MFQPKYLHHRVRYQRKYLYNQRERKRYPRGYRTNTVTYRTRYSMSAAGGRSGGVLVRRLTKTIEAPASNQRSWLPPCPWLPQAPPVMWEVRSSTPAPATWYVLQKVSRYFPFFTFPSFVICFHLSLFLSLSPSFILFLPESSFSQTLSLSLSLPPAGWLALM